MKQLPKNKPQFCFIAPINYLDWTLCSNRHLVLAHLIVEQDKDKKHFTQQYINHYKYCSDRGDYIICDNSAFELGGSYPPEKLIEAAKLVAADSLVLPDYPDEDPEKTVKAAEQWIPEFKKNDLHTFFVPQAKKGDLEGWIDSYKWAANNPDIDIIGMSILGIPNALPHLPAAYARVVMAQILVDRGLFNFNKYHHWLGLNSGPKLELPALIKMGVLDSCDSSGPIWSALEGFDYREDTDSFMSCHKARLPHVDFYKSYDKYTENYDSHRLHNNIKMTLSLFKDA